MTIAGTNRTRGRKPGPPDARVIKAIGHPLRWQILEALNEGEASPAGLARRFGEGVNLVAYHMGVLVKAGAAELTRTEPRRGSTEHYYRATMRPFFADREWARLPKDTRRAVVEAEVKKITKDVQRAIAGPGFEDPKAHVSWTPMELDREGYDEVVQLLGETLEKLADVQSRASERQSKRRANAAPPRPTEVAMLHFDRVERRRKSSTR